ncbi:hypothetical protein P692DRAFT_20239715 [Suillus brevipes Sb2]|nr:hypothetical protein P692DRAFT_20239715 [Suillus brevipes Sb2]
MRRGDGGDFACCIPERLSYTAFVAVWARFVPSLPSSALQQLRGYVRLLPALSPISITLFHHEVASQWHSSCHAGALIES